MSIEAMEFDVKNSHIIIHGLTGYDMWPKYFKKRHLFKFKGWNTEFISKKQLILIFWNETFLDMSGVADFNIELFSTWFTSIEHSHMLRPLMISQAPWIREWFVTLVALEFFVQVNDLIMPLHGKLGRILPWTSKTLD